MNNITLNQLDLDFNSTTEEYYATAVHKGTFWRDLVRWQFFDFVNFVTFCLLISIF